jgi:hypothetical protein
MGFNDSIPKYWEAWFPIDEQIYIRYYSGYDLFGFQFELVKTYLNDQQVTFPAIDVEYLIFKITVRDFANVILHEQYYNFNDSKYIDIMLLVGVTRFFNDGDEDSIVHLKRNNVVSTFLIGAHSEKELRLSDGDYDIWIENDEGEEVDEEKEIEIENGGNFNVTWFQLEVTEPEVTQVLNALDYALVFGILAIIPITIGIGFRIRSGRSGSRSSGSRSRNSPSIMRREGKTLIR